MMADLVDSGRARADFISSRGLTADTDTDLISKSDVKSDPGPPDPPDWPACRGDEAV
jgi:hypothetical protein